MVSLQIETLLDAFLHTARSPSSIEDFVLECGSERWTYGDLDSISSGLALELHQHHGLRPTVAVLSENHPYTFALLLATWKLGGIVAPLDHNSPLDMIKQMAENLQPTCVLVPEEMDAAMEIFSALGVRVMSLAKNTTMTQLMQRYIDQTAFLPHTLFPPPFPSSLALYIHTSSASSILNLKCVQLTHASIAKGSLSTAEWSRKAWPALNFSKLRVLGWAPWSHVIGIVHDIGASVFATGGCYVFGAAPSGYPMLLDGDSMSSTKEMDMVDHLLAAALRTRPDIMMTVPLFLEGFRKTYLAHLAANEVETASLIKEMLLHLKGFGVGGALVNADTFVWAKDLGVKVTSNIGMTELGGPLFISKDSDINGEAPGWSIDDLTIEDGILLLLDQDGNEVSTGDITSRQISHGYLKYDTSAFKISPDGWITFKTGDIYERTTNMRYVWKGRKEDYIQLISSETLDPRPLEKALNECPAIAHCAIVGNNFLSKASDYVCAIIQPVPIETTSGPHHEAALSMRVSEITRKIAAVNRTLLPPLRISWSRVLILDPGVEIPYTKKGMVFRKKLEGLFSAALHSWIDKDAKKDRSRALTNGVNGARSISQPKVEVPRKAEVPKATSKNWNKDEVGRLVVDALASGLHIDPEVLRLNAEASFAELGMNSDMAVRIVNKLNEAFMLKLPLNTCHTYIDLKALINAIMVTLGIKEGLPSPPVPKKKPSSLEPEEIVIVGQAVRLPGDINTLDAFWDALIQKRDDLMTKAPPDRWDADSFYRSPNSTAPPRNGDILFPKSGFVDVAHFDNSFFGISKPEALYVSPATRLTLETAFEALENAGIPMSKVKGMNMGVFVATGMDTGYVQLLHEEKGFGAYTRFFGTGIASSAACGRLSYLLDVHGPSTTSDTACSSGLVVFDQAVKYLQSGDGEAAIISASNTTLWPGSFSFLSAQKMASPNSRCATFTNEADGYVPSEGSLSFVLKTKSAALRDGDNILAVVKSTDVKHGGRSQGLVAPNVHTQIALQRSLLQKAGMEPSEIDFLETHGTGTSLGDLIEIQGINEVFQNSHSQRRPLVLGAAKTCVGHTELAAGLVGVLKALASFKYGAVPGLMHLTETNMNPAIDCGVVPVHIPHETVSLSSKPDQTPQYGLVLSNGFSGTIAGIILEEPKGLSISSPANGMTENISMPFVISAKSVQALRQYLINYLEFCRKALPSEFQNICYTTCVGREHYKYRFGCVASNLGDLIQNLEEALRSLSFRGDGNTAGRILFAFPGQGSQYQGMASELAIRYPEFKDILVFASTTATNLSGHPILSFLMDTTGAIDLETDDGRLAQVCIFVYQYSISVWLRTLGIEPSAVLGHSLGEIAGAVIAGGLTYELGLELVIKRSEILRSDPAHPGGMAIIATSKATITDLLRQLGLEGRLVIAVYNGAQSHVVSGEMVALDTFLLTAKTRGFRASKLQVAQGFHSPSIHPSLPALQSWLDENHRSSSRLNIPLYSTVYGTKVSEGSRLLPVYWLEHARDSVRFSDAMAAVESDMMVDVVLDIGPQPHIWTSLQSLPHTKLALATSTKKSKDQNVAFLQAIVSLFTAGVAPDFDKLFARNSLHLRRTTIPTYPFQRQRHFPDFIPSRNSETNQRRSISKSEAIPENTTRAVPFIVDHGLCDLLIDHQIEGRRVLPGASLADFFATHTPSKSLKIITFHAPVIIQSPQNEIFSNFDAHGSFSMVQGSAKVCSGIIAPESNFVMTNLHTSQPPEYVRSKDEVYGGFKSVQFGPSFRNVQEVRTWPTHAEALIAVKATGFTVLDRIRKLDSCFHAFGAIVQGEVPQIRELDGSFLPSSLEGFTLHSNDLPDTFVCRYRLPLDAMRNFHLISTSFEVVSLAGELLVSCTKYSVAWIPINVVLQNEEKSIPTPRARHWLQQHWTTQQLEIQHDLLTQLDHLLYIHPQGHDSGLLGSFSARAGKISTIALPAKNSVDELDARCAPVFEKFNNGTSVSIVFDLTSFHDIPTTEGSLHYHHGVLRLMKILSRAKIDIRSLVVISEMSIPTQTDLLSTAHFSRSNIQPPGLGAVVQGMLRVFRRETGLDTQFWGLDLPPLGSVADSTLREILFQEITARRNGLVPDRTVAYRPSEQGVLIRMVPSLKAVDYDDHPLQSCGGVSVIVGFGSIGSALAPALVSNGSTRIAFIGRRNVDNEVLEALGRLEKETNGQCDYFQADVCDLDSLRSSFQEIQRRFGPIENIIHMAAIIQDATVQNVEVDSFERVLRPKVLGAWNLHIVSQELCTSLKSFVLLGSISVSLGNQGQIAYVAGNSFMEALASYRRGSNLPATCLQLGPWESRLTQNHEFSSNSLLFLMDNHTGIPLILRSMFAPYTVQIVAKMNGDAISSNLAYRDDPLFRSIISTVARPAKKSPNKMLTEREISDVMMQTLKRVLELGSSEQLEPSDSLISCGVDSISFAQVRGKVMNQLEVEIPMKFLSDSFTIGEIVEYVKESYKLLHG